MFVWRSQNFLRYLNMMNFFSETSPIQKEVRRTSQWNKSSGIAC